MATVKSGTLTANVVATGSVTGCAPDGAELLNLTGGGTIWYRTDGTDPTIGGDNCHPLVGSRRIPGRAGADTITVKMIAASALAWALESDPR